MTFISIRLSEDQKKILNGKAKESRLSRNAYILSKLFPPDDGTQSNMNIDDMRRIENSIRAMVEQKYGQQHKQLTAGFNLLARYLAENNHMLTELFKYGSFNLAFSDQFKTEEDYQSQKENCDSLLDEYKNNATVFADKNFPTKKED